MSDVTLTSSTWEVLAKFVAICQEIDENEEEDN